jgi:membrane protein
LPFFFGQSQATEILVQQISSVVGPSVADLFRQLLSESGSPFSSFWTAIFVVGFSLGGAIGAFSVLRDTMNCIWEVRFPKGRPLWKRIRQKIWPFVLVSALGLIVLGWTALASSLSSLIIIYSGNRTLTLIAFTVSQILLSFGIATLLLAIIYKMIPSTKVHWQDVNVASLVTGTAFTVTNYIFGAYIQTFTVTTLIGTAGALVIILLWVFVLNQIILFGAELSKVYATNAGLHSRQHFLTPIERLLEPLNKAGERIEQATKDEFETNEKSSKESEEKKKEEQAKVEQ